MDIMARLEADVDFARGNPEGVEVEVLTTDRDLARRVAPLMASRLYPGRKFGEILGTPELTDDGTTLVVVRDLGIPGLTTQGAHPSAYGAGR